MYLDLQYVALGFSSDLDILNVRLNKRKIPPGNYHLMDSYQANELWAGKAEFLHSGVEKPGDDAECVTEH